eukprot:TRINITY_DN13801_c0_g3_i1.p1 TRINITY_DN13801_c0_g3~~TRINITY_DN13801_c0_g3_i1.p1  ORF type:complete len:182 (+),score=15.80 TRINITY_DN13801_c0_g3_i1:658-1203(+)
MKSITRIRSSTRRNSYFITPSVSLFCIHTEQNKNKKEKQQAFSVLHSPKSLYLHLENTLPFCFLHLGHHNPKHPFLHLGLNLIQLVKLRRQINPTALLPPTLITLRFLLSFSFDNQRIPLHRNLNILLPKSRQVNPHIERVVFFFHIPCSPRSLHLPFLFPWPRDSPSAPSYSSYGSGSQE